MDERMKASLEAIFKPRSVAVVGASNNRDRWGYETMHTMLAANFRNELYPVNPNEKVVHGLPCYPSLSAIPDEIDLAIIVVNASLVPKVLEECIELKVKSGIVITAGFAEVSQEGAEQQKRLAERARETGFNFIGPNCWGVWSSAGRVNTLFWDHMIPPTGTISFVSQSGTLGEYFYQAALEFGFGMEKFVSCGNQACINVVDLIEYLGDDPDTEVVTAYIEDIGDGRRFIEVARRVAAKKPLLIYKAGTTEAGARAARSHTAAMAANDGIFDAACRQAGIIRWHDFREMFLMAAALSFQPPMKGNRVAVLSGGGGFCVTTAEACTRIGLELPEIDPQTRAEIMKHMNGFAPPPVNPIDMIARKGDESWLKTMDLVAGLDYIDGLIISQGLGRFDRTVTPEDMIRRIEMAEKLTAIARKHNKPLVAANEQKPRGPIYEILMRNRVPFFNDPTDCAAALYALSRYKPGRYS